ncbi:uncharacterized protein [Watersipora subatra]|uniref:uncharacterized protein n=1 Tax=Watersipora subatra TaxID=2589382 RepID=UPI00355BE720
MGDLLVEITKELYDREMQLQAIEEMREGGETPPVRAVKTYIRTKSGRVVERIVFLAADDYERFARGGGNASDVLKKYLTKDEASNLQSWDKEEVKMIKTFVRTKSGKLKEKTVYVNKSDYDKIKSGGMDGGEMMKVLKRYVKTEAGEKISGWGEAQTKQIKTMVRTKSGRMVEKTIVVSKEEYDELQKVTKAGGDPSKILQKYLAQDEKVESWQKVAPKPKAVKVVKTMVRTKSGKMVEKAITMTEEEYKAFEKSGGSKEFLQKLIKLEEGETLENWEKASTVYEAASDDEITQNAAAGHRLVGDDGNVYEVVVDEKTGKKYKKKLGKAEEFDDLDDLLVGGDGGAGGRAGKGGKKGAWNEEKGAKKKKGKGRKGVDGGDDSDSDENEPIIDEHGNKLPSKAAVKKYKALKEGKRNADSASDYSYKSVHSAGGTRKVVRRRKRADGTYSAEQVYNSDKDEEGKKRRRQRRREKKHGPNSAHSYFSVVSAGGTRKVLRRKKNADGTRGEVEDYHSDDSIIMKKASKQLEKREKAKEKRRVHGSDSEFSYRSVVSAGGTKTKVRKQRIRDADGKVIGHGKEQIYVSDSDSMESYIDTTGKRVVRQKPSRNKGKDGKGERGRRGEGRQRQKLKKTREHFKGGFSDHSTDTEDEPDLENMTVEEKRVYLKEKAARKAAREQKRREKYGDKYEEIMAKHESNKKQLRKERAMAEGVNWDSDEYEADPEGFKTKYQSMVTYDKGGDRRLTKNGKPDNRALGQGHEEWGKTGGKKIKKVLKKDGDESDYESDEERYGERTKRKGEGRKGRNGKAATGYVSSDGGESFIGADGKKKKRMRKGVDEVVESDFEYEIEYDEKGRIKKKKKKYHDGASGSEYEYEYDAAGNVVGKQKTKEGLKTKKHITRDKFDNDDGNYFEKDKDGRIRLRAGKKKIDITKLTEADLRALGIDPTLSKQNLARALKAQFGGDLRIMDGGQKVGLKALEDFGSDVNTDDLAGESDLDTSTLQPGRRRVNILMRKGGNELLGYMKKLVDDSALISQPLEVEREGGIDYLSVYRLVDQKVVDGYARAFVVEDSRKTGIIHYSEARTALEGIASISGMKEKQIDYVMKILEVSPHDNMSFRMFGVAAALGERITKMDSHCKELLDISDLADIERKLELYKEIFYCNNNGDRDPNYIKCEALMIELIAGGLSWQQQDYVMTQLRPNTWHEVSFLDYLVYIPLFLSMHDGICMNPLDMSLEKFKRKRLTKGPATRDLNPLGHPLKKKTAWQNRKMAEELLDGTGVDRKEAQDRSRQILNKYARLPEIIGTMEKRPPGAPRYF